MIERERGTKSRMSWNLAARGRKKLDENWIFSEALLDIRNWSIELISIVWKWKRNFEPFSCLVFFFEKKKENITQVKKNSKFTNWKMSE